MNAIVTLELDEALINSVQHYAIKHNFSIAFSIHRDITQQSGGQAFLDMSGKS